MQRLQDIVSNDLDYIFNQYRDFVKFVKLQCGGQVVQTNCSLQGDKIDMTADITPANAYSLTLYYIESTNEDFNKSLKHDAIIFADGVAFKIIDTNLTMGLRMISMERHKGR